MEQLGTLGLGAGGCRAPALHALRLRNGLPGRRGGERVLRLQCVRNGLPGRRSGERGWLRRTENPGERPRIRCMALRQCSPIVGVNRPRGSSRRAPLDEAFLWCFNVGRDCSRTCSTRRGLEEALAAVALCLLRFRCGRRWGVLKDVIGHAICVLALRTQVFMSDFSWRSNGWQLW